MKLPPKVITKDNRTLCSNKKDGIRDDGRNVSSEAQTALIYPLKIQFEEAYGGKGSASTCCVSDVALLR